MTPQIPSPILPIRPRRSKRFRLSVLDWAESIKVVLFVGVAAAGVAALTHYMPAYSEDTPLGAFMTAVTAGLIVLLKRFIQDNRMQ